MWLKYWSWTFNDGFIHVELMDNLEFFSERNDPMKCIILALITLFTASQASARVFSFDSETVAPFINIRGGLSSMSSAPFEWQSASSYSGDEVDLIYGGEFGIYFRSSLGLGVSLGVLVDTFDPVEGGAASNAGGVSLFTVNTEGLSYGPSLLFDYQFGTTQSYLWKFVFGGGYQFAEIENTYSMTATGQALVGGQSTFTETYKAEIPFAMIGIGTEFVLSGTSTMSFLLGYHYALANEWSYGQGGQNFAGSHTQDGDVLFENGSKKTIDWSYPFLQVGFNFYVDTVR